jgi:RNA polymerase sigma-70 factor, ECF subfamily
VALDSLLRREYDRIHAVCRRVCGNPADGADATQEALIKIVRALPTFDGSARFSTWAYRIATNAALDEVRRRKRRPEPVEAANEHGAPGDVGEQAAAAVDVDAAMATVPKEFRAAVVLRDLCGLDYAEIAEVLDIPPGTVRSRIARGRAALARHLTGNPTPSTERPTPEP